MAFKRLVRFPIGDRVSFGDLLSVNGGTYRVRRLTGDPFTKLQPTEEIIQVDKVSLASKKFIFSLLTTCQLLCPIDRTPLIVLVGLNYQNHVNEAKVRIPHNMHPVVHAC
jgi:2-keto-4-pentenoate hydratase/2-oxohepta-3-ene-1,7-dioic acid hydratase in catechol pathway